MLAATSYGHVALNVLIRFSDVILHCVCVPFGLFRLIIAIYSFCSFNPSDDKQCQ